MIKNNQLNNVSIYSMFKDVGDAFWLWLYTSGYYKRPVLHGIMPNMPEQSLQLQFTGCSGNLTLREAFLFYRFVKSTARQHGIVIGPGIKILDFGCGWGRVVRFFLKDLPASDLYCSDCDGEIVDVCRKLNLKVTLSINNPYPPIEFEDKSFDIIYSYSVFSHLSEDAHKHWLAEFQRILKPGGVFIATTRPRDFVFWCEKTRKMAKVPISAQGAAMAFLNAEEKLKEYDDGKYIYDPVGGGGIRDGSFYGETCIPEKYIRTEWTKYFRQVDFIYYKKHGYFNQNAIIAQK
ncbi:MAG: class I SAM-dependent methyltransferase [Candidatus Omnitrophota bacterium]